MISLWGMKPADQALGSEKNLHRPTSLPITPESSPYSRAKLFAWPSPMLCPNSCARTGALDERMSDQHAPARGASLGFEQLT
eukprot:scaffold18403_cov48-Phaeocystis_antarctica.AAC.1